MPGLKTLAVVVTVKGGARWEPQDRSGWSHLLEHLVFKGAGDMAAREIVERIEAEGGTINASTGYERTSFEVRGLEGTLALNMQVLSDLVFRPALDPAEIEREKDVVAQEIAEAFDTPDDHVFEMVQTRAFTGQPLGRPILGSVDSLKPADKASVEAWRARLYSPDRMVVSASGAVEEGELLALAERWFGDAVATPVPAPAPAAFVGGPGRALEEAMTALTAAGVTVRATALVGGHATLTRKIEQANLVFQLPALSATDPALSSMRLFGEILGGGMASRLFQSAREERGLAYAIDAYQEPYEDTGVLGIYAGAAADRARELAQVAAGEVRALAETGPTEKELSRAKAVMKAGLWMSDENPMSRAGRNAAQTLIFGAPRSSLSMTEQLEAQTVEAVRAVGGRMLAGGQAASAVLGPKSAAPAGEAFTAALFGG